MVQMNTSVRNNKHSIQISHEDLSELLVWNIWIALILLVYYFQQYGPLIIVSTCKIYQIDMFNNDSFHEF